MNRLLFAVAIVLGSCSSTTAVTRFTPLGPTAWAPFDAWRLSRASQAPIDVYVARRAQRPASAVLILSGSTCLPLFNVAPNRRASHLFLQGLVAARVERLAFVAFDRRGLRSFVPMRSLSDDDIERMSECTPSHGGIDLRERVDDAVVVARALLREPWVSRLFIVGHSEGAEIAARVARVLGERVAAVALFSGADAGTIEPLRGVVAPIFIAHGRADDVVPFAAAQSTYEAVRRQRAESVRFDALDGCDHGLSRVGGGESCTDAVFDAFIEWGSSQASRPAPR